MFDFVRKHTKLMMALLFLLIIPSFVLWGVDGYRRFNEGGDTVAHVAGSDIKRMDWDNAHKLEVDRLRGQQPTLDAKIFDTPEAKYATLERLVRERLLAAVAEKEGYATSDARLARALGENPTIAALRRPDGSLDMERYKQLVGSQGMTPEMFEARVRADLSSRQVVDGLASTGLATPALAKVSLDAFYDRREVQWLRIDAKAFEAKVQPTDAELEAYHREHSTQFQAPEQADVEYVVLDLESIKKTITLPEADVRTYFEQNAARYAGSEERRASHILIAADKSAGAEARAKAKATAAQLLVDARKAPDRFADLARKNSQDPGSAPQGGDLGYFGRGAMVKPFEDAAFALKPGEVSDVVESDFGYHVIRLTDIRGAKKRSFEELRADIEADLRTQQAQRKFAEAADTFTNGVYEQSDTYATVAEKLKLEVRKASGVSRRPPGAENPANPLSSQKLLAALFSGDSIDKRRNTEAIEIGPNRLASARIVKHEPARALPLAEVRDRVRARVVATKAAELARKDGEAKLAALKADANAFKLAPAVVVSRDVPGSLPPKVLDAALRADLSSAPSLAGVDLGDAGYALVRVNKRVPRDERPAAEAKLETEQYTQAFAIGERQAYLELLKQRYKVEILVAKPKASGVEALIDGLAR